MVLRNKRIRRINIDKNTEFMMQAVDVLSVGYIGTYIQTRNIERRIRYENPTLL